MATDQSSEKPKQGELFGEERPASRVGRKHVYSKDEWDKIVERYIAGDNGSTLEREFCVDRTSIYRQLRKRNLQPRKGGSPSIISDSMVDAMLADLRAGASLSDAYRRFSLSSEVFYRWLHKGESGEEGPCKRLYDGVSEVCGRGGARSRGSRRHTVNDSYFQAIDTPEKAWLLGFIAADGCVSNFRLQFRVAWKDREVLTTIKRLLESDAPIAYEKPKLYVVARPIGRMNKSFSSHGSGVLTVCSHVLVSDLFLHGISENKTFTVKPWDGPPHLLSHYYRGVIDGDGSISRRQQRKCDGAWVWQVMLCGNQWIVGGFADFVGGLTGSRPTVHPDVNTFRTTAFGIDAVRSTLAALYPLGCVALRRKQLLAEQAQLTTRVIADLSQLTAACVRDAYQRAGSWYGAAKLLGISQGGMLGIRKRLGLFNR